MSYDTYAAKLDDQFRSRAMTHTRQNWMTNSGLLITVLSFEEKDLAPGVPLSKGKKQTRQDQPPEA